VNGNLEVSTNSNFDGFDLGINIEDILKEMEEMGMRTEIRKKTAKLTKTCSDKNKIGFRKQRKNTPSTSPEKVTSNGLLGDFEDILASIADTDDVYEAGSENQMSDNSLDYSMANEKSNPEENSYWDPSEIFVHLASKSEKEKRSAGENLLDITRPIKGERQPRFFYTFDRGSAFNTSMALTIPLFSFTLPGQF
jgi:hypothetical protein